MIATAPKIANSSKALHSQLEKIKVDTGQRCTAEVSRRFLLSALSASSKPAVSGGPTDQDIECLRQATFKHRLETGSDRASGTDLLRTLEKLGYV